MILDEGAFPIKFKAKLTQYGHSNAKIAECHPRVENSLHCRFVKLIINPAIIGKDEGSNQAYEEGTIVKLMVSFGSRIIEKEKKSHKSKNVGVKEDDNQKLFEIKFFVGPGAG